MARENSTTAVLPPQRQNERKNNSRTIFRQEDGRAVQFFLLPTADKVQIKQTIERYGGIVVAQPEEECIVVSYQDGTPAHLQSHPIVNVDYVIQSLAAGKMLPFGSFLLSAPSFKENAKLHSSPIKQQTPGSPTKNSSPVRKAPSSPAAASPVKNSSPIKAKATLSSPLIKSTASPFKPLSSPKGQQQQTPTEDFSEENDYSLFLMVQDRLEKDRMGFVLSYDYDGHQIFRDIYESRRFPSQTITSLKQRYQSRILPNISQYLAKQSTSNQRKRPVVELELEDEQPESMHMDSSFEFATQAAPTQHHHLLHKDKELSAFESSTDCPERDCALHLAEAYNVTYEVAVYALYVTSGSVRDARLLLADPAGNAHLAWGSEDDMVILTNLRSPSKYNYNLLVQARGADAVHRRSQFLDLFISVVPE